MLPQNACQTPPWQQNSPTYLHGFLQQPRQQRRTTPLPRPHPSHPRCFLVHHQDRAASRPLLLWRRGRGLRREHGQSHAPTLRCRPDSALKTPRTQSRRRGSKQICFGVAADAGCPFSLALVSPVRKGRPEPCARRAVVAMSTRASMKRHASAASGWCRRALQSTKVGREIGFSPSRDAEDGFLTRLM